MFLKTSLVGLVCLGMMYVQNVIASPVLPTIPFAVEGGSDTPGTDLAVAIIGAGAGGETTYVAFDPAVTATLIAGASEATAVAVFTDEVGGAIAVATQSAACGIQDGDADCTLTIAGVFDSVSITVLKTTSGPADFVTLVFSAGPPTAGGDGASTTGTDVLPSSFEASSAVGKSSVACTFMVTLSLLLAAVSLA